MVGIIVSFAAGIACSAGVGFAVAYKLRLQSTQYERQITTKNASIREYELDKAYRDGQESARLTYQFNLNAANSECQRLRVENDRLREQLGNETIFAHSLASTGSAAIHLKRTV